MSPPLSCAGNCLRLAAACSPSSRFQPFKVISPSSSTSVHLLEVAVFSPTSTCYIYIFTDGPEVSWEARWQHPKPSLDCNPKDLCVDNSVKANGLSRQQVHHRQTHFWFTIKYKWLNIHDMHVCFLSIVCHFILNAVAQLLKHTQICRGWDSSLWAEDVDEGGVMMLARNLDCRSRDSSPVRRRAQQRQNRARGPLNRSCSVPDSNNPPCFPCAAHGDINVPVCDLTEIGADEHLSSTWSSKRDRFNRGQSCDSYPLTNAEEMLHSGLIFKEDTAKTFSSGETKIQAPKPLVHKSEQSPPNSSRVSPSLYVPNNHMTKSMLCLNEESQDEVSRIKPQHASQSCQGLCGALC